MGKIGRRRLTDAATNGESDVPVVANAQAVLASFRALAGGNRCKKKRIAKSPVPNTACKSTHRSQMRLVIRVDDGPGCRLHPLQRLAREWAAAHPRKP